MQLKNRIKKLEDLLKFKTKRSDKDFDSMSIEEAGKIVNNLMDDPQTPLYVKTKDGYADIQEIKSEDELQRITDDYARMRIKLFTEFELKQMVCTE